MSRWLVSWINMFLSWSRAFIEPFNDWQLIIPLRLYMQPGSIFVGGRCKICLHLFSAKYHPLSSWKLFMGVFVKTRRTDSNRCAAEFNTVTIRQTPLLHCEKVKTGKSKYRRFCTTANNHRGLEVKKSTGRWRSQPRRNRSDPSCRREVRIGYSWTGDAPTHSHLREERQVRFSKYYVLCNLG